MLHFLQNKKMMSKLLDSAVFPGSQGGPLEHIIAAKAVAFGEALKTEFKEYSKQIVSNSKTMDDEFIKLDYNLISGGTDTHVLLIDLINYYLIFQLKKEQKV